MNDLILQPVILMCLLSFIMMLWMYATRIPASKEIEPGEVVIDNDVKNDHDLKIKISDSEYFYP